MQAAEDAGRGGRFNITALCAAVGFQLIDGGLYASPPHCRRELKIKLEEDRKRLVEAINTTFGNLVRGCEFCCLRFLGSGVPPASRNQHHLWPGER